MSNPILDHFPQHFVEPVTTACSKLLSDVCCTKFIHNFDFQDSDCIKQFVAKFSGYLIVVGASLVKLPQVVKIFKAKSGAGITLFGVLLELIAITFNACYSFRNNFPFSAWGEAIFLAIETALIAFLIFCFDGKKLNAVTFLSTYSIMVFALTHPTLISKDVLWYLQSTVLPLAVTGKLIQAFKNYKAQHTGQLSAVTAWAIFAGSLVRIFTTLQETGDMLTAVTFAFSSTANATIAIQVLYYWKSTKKFLEKGKKKKAN